jgi:ADP-heptose:LPS heptosyltransferase
LCARIPVRSNRTLACNGKTPESDRAHFYSGHPQRHPIALVQRQRLRHEAALGLHTEAARCEMINDHDNVGATNSSEARRVLLFRALQLGDMLCATPALRAIRRALPNAEIVLLGLPWAQKFAERFSMYFDGFRAFPGYPGLPEITPQLARIPAFLRGIQNENFDLVIQMHGSGSIVNPLVMLFAAKQAGGFFVPGDYCPNPERFMPWPVEGLESRRLLRLVEFLGFPAHGDELEFPVRPGDYRSLFSVAEIAQLKPGRFVCLHAGASVAERRWPADRFVAVGRWLQTRGLSVVLTGTAAESELSNTIQQALGNTAIDLCGKTDLGSLAALLMGAKLLICNDTGVSHLADALHVPSVVVSTGNNAERWAPRNHVLHRTLAGVNGMQPVEVIQQATELIQLRDSKRDLDAGAIRPAWPEWFTAASLAL